MFKHTLVPRFAETDALGHVSNTAFPIWFEDARMPIFKMFHPELDVENWTLILARQEIDHTAQSYVGREVSIETEVGKLGNSSFEVCQRAYQEGKLIAKTKVVMVHFDYDSEKSQPLPAAIRQQLQAHQGEEALTTAE